MERLKYYQSKYAPFLAIFNASGMVAWFYLFWQGFAPAWLCAIGLFMSGMGLAQPLYHILSRKDDHDQV